MAANLNFSSGLKLMRCICGEMQVLLVALVLSEEFLQLRWQILRETLFVSCVIHLLEISRSMSA